VEPDDVEPDDEESDVDEDDDDEDDPFYFDRGDHLTQLVATIPDDTNVMDGGTCILTLSVCLSVCLAPQSSWYR